MSHLLSLSGLRNPRSRLFASVLATAAALCATVVASSTWGPTDSRPRVNSRTESASGADVRTARARAIAAARALKASHTRRPEESSLAHQRTADASNAGALFASHSWYVAPPPPPPVAPTPPAPPEAPPFPYTFVGSYAPAGDNPVYFLARADRVIDAHVGDRLDGVYSFESAGSGSLVFNYLPLNVRQSVPIGVSP
jgi:hypothetical protein